VIVTGAHAGVHEDALHVDKAPGVPEWCGSQLVDRELGREDEGDDWPDDTEPEDEERQRTSDDGLVWSVPPLPKKGLHFVTP
jgi:hypothetical protein